MGVWSKPRMNQRWKPLVVLFGVIFAILGTLFFVGGSSGRGLVMLVAPADAGLDLKVDGVPHHLAPNQHFLDRFEKGPHTFELPSGPVTVQVEGNKSQLFLPLGRCFVLLDVKRAFYGSGGGEPKLLQRLGPQDIADIGSWSGTQWPYFEDDQLPPTIAANDSEVRWVRSVDCAALGAMDDILISTIDHGPLKQR
jgi:hypothetical protein